jgi:acetylornithine deacetylase/succinyl-diaminopimelate desuccinylase-like protein
MDRFFSYVDEHETLYKDRLAEAVAIPSISAELDDHLSDICAMMDWTAAHIRRLGGSYELRPNPAGPDRLPPILLAEFPAGNTMAHTVCVYGHLDVQPAQQSDGWDTDPFVLTERDGKLYGRGSTDDKGPALSWLWVIEAHQELGIPLPINIKLLYEYVLATNSSRYRRRLMSASSENILHPHHLTFPTEHCFNHHIEVWKKMAVRGSLI